MYQFGLGPGPASSIHTDFSIPGWGPNRLHSFYEPLTGPPERGSIIPRPLGPLDWATHWSRDPATGAVLFNANDPILAGSRLDPSGFAVVYAPPPELAALPLLARYWAAGVARRRHTRAVKARLKYGF